MDRNRGQRRSAQHSALGVGRRSPPQRASAPASIDRPHDPVPRSRPGPDGLRGAGPRCGAGAAPPRNFEDEIRQTSSETGSAAARCGAGSTRPGPAGTGTGRHRRRSTARAQSQLGRIGPGLAEGRLWVRPLPLPPRELAQRLTRSRAELVDSAVTAIVQAYLDSIANDPASKNQALPSWTTEIAGKKFGLDSKNIYIAGLKIPAAVLALLPIPAGNIDQNRAYNHLMDIRADLLYAARRAETMEEFKKVIREIRLRKEREREFEKNQRTAPPPEEPLTP